MSLEPDHSDTRPVVLFSDRTDVDLEPAQRLLAAHGFDSLVAGLPASPDAEDPARLLSARARGAVGMVVGYARISSRILEALPELRVIATTSAGTEMVDVVAAQARGMSVIPLRDAATEEVATHSLALMLAVERQLPRATDIVGRGLWTEALTVGAPASPRRLSGLTLGLLGHGRIARRLTSMAAPLVREVIAHDPRNVGEGATTVSLEELLRRSDILSLHVPLTDGTRGIIGADALASLPTGAILINCSRGELVDEAALLEAVDSGRLRGAGLDVLHGEPPAPAAPLRHHPAVICTPHAAYWSADSLLSYGLDPARAVIEHLRA
ncbi:NAD(P)-dependent oxidoreductase [Nesterenkonia sp. HG001]|uniref:NAD(P)-dependent oxidoreductase n=1 Tax=Nesterenkonia sp. HG001 TaxID=2983207 RepID=UPI002AC745DC|nr:NAD(P)-dependent oxidoreductase [Nesterenkonia sp. HG001]MDZ5079189.1 C-terminal binding protein [Nesterenkonia sp. HG001]